MAINKIAHMIMNMNRKRKYDLFIANLVPKEKDAVLDVGFSDIEYSSYDNYLEKNYKYLENITALGIDEPNNFKQKYPQVKVAKYDGKIFPFGNKEFDIGWSNAVLEHVGNKESQINFVKELVRTCKRIIFTTPNKLFPVEVHTRIPILHYLPKKVFDKILILIGKRWATGSYMNLLSINELKDILNKAGITDYQIIRNKLLYLTLDFVVIIKSGHK